MRSLLLATAAAAVALTLAGCVADEAASTAPNNDGFTPSAVPEETETPTETPIEESPAGDATSTQGACQFTADGTDLAVGLPPDQGPVPQTSLALDTSAGPITIQLDATRAPCTVQSVVYLASAGFYNGLGCHRLTASDALKVLQCGDPNGDGTGGPGYTVRDEPPTDLQPGPQGTAIYPRGVVAMAKSAQPNSTGSQFFLVYGDSTLSPDYNVIGTIDEAGLATVDQVAAAGFTPGDRPQEGAPTTPVTITSATAA
jgi:peptidyl-prolyl cis-trans isomerase B (cyclophilin B)